MQYCYNFDGVGAKPSNEVLKLWDFFIHSCSERKILRAAMLKKDYRG